METSYYIAFTAVAAAILAAQVVVIWGLSSIQRYQKVLVGLMAGEVVAFNSPEDLAEFLENLEEQDKSGSDDS